MVTTTTVITSPCIRCGERSELEVDLASYTKWKDNVLIQTAFPAMSISDRELLITGTHDECWEEMFAHDHEEE